jgi:hypothetical protein
MEKEEANRAGERLIGADSPDRRNHAWRILRALAIAALSDEGTCSVEQLKYHFSGGEKLLQKQTQLADL